MGNREFFIKQLKPDHVVVVFDQEQNTGSLCSDDGKWPGLFSLEQAKEVAKSMSSMFPDSAYRIFKLTEVINGV